ncbi:hypothetical protein H4R24_005479 [Coemansia sp. RSA 988]|nr:hypothetical protein H4R24_005479 [Coemansia sp. RSA 988]
MDSDNEVNSLSTHARLNCQRQQRSLPPVDPAGRVLTDAYFDEAGNIAFGIPPMAEGNSPMHEAVTSPLAEMVGGNVDPSVPQAFAAINQLVELFEGQRNENRTLTEQVANLATQVSTLLGNGTATCTTPGAEPTPLLAQT